MLIKALPFLSLCYPALVTAVRNGLARTPQMGWNNWNSLGCDVSESLLLETSRKLVDYGLKDVGYNYVVLDDCWQDPAGRDSTDHIIVDAQKFPNGMKYVAEQLHSQGLLYGMYSSAGEMTCARYEGSLDYETEDAESYASWDVDYLKYDNCYHRGRFGYPEISFNRYNVMAEALKKAAPPDRPIFYSLCTWGEDYVHTWGQALANSWRISGDIYDNFNRPDELCSCTDTSSPFCVAPGSHCSIMNIINRVAPYVDRGHPGGWNDLDMLEVGNGGMSDTEYVAHFSMWAAIKSPLLIGADLREMNGKALSILNNPAVIAVSQDPLGFPAHLIRRDTNVPKDPVYGEGETQIWSGPLYSDNDQLVVFLNAADADLEMTSSLPEIFIHSNAAEQTRQKWDVYDLWANRMDDAVAEQIVGCAASSAAVAAARKGWYNATETPYLDGLKQNDARLLGKKVAVFSPGEEIKVQVERHGVKMFRLRAQGGTAGKRYTIAKDEL